MKFLIAILLGVVILLPSVAVAGTDCTTRRSGSVTITSCSDNNNPKNFNTQCRSYKSGSSGNCRLQ